MKWGFLLSAVLELSAGIIVYLYPTLVFSDALGVMPQFLGLALFVLGIMNFLCFRHYEASRFFKLMYLGTMFYHAVIAMICYRSGTELLHASAATITHLGVFVLLLIAYMQDIKPS